MITQLRKSSTLRVAIEALIFFLGRHGFELTGHQRFPGGFGQDYIAQQDRLSHRYRVLKRRCSFRRLLGDLDEVGGHLMDDCSRIHQGVSSCARRVRSRGEDAAAYYLLKSSQVFQSPRLKKSGATYQVAQGQDLEC